MVHGGQHEDAAAGEENQEAGQLDNVEKRFQLNFFLSQTGKHSSGETMKTLLNHAESAAAKWRSKSTGNLISTIRVFF
jgi:hypothetical protein